MTCINSRGPPSRIMFGRDNVVERWVISHRFVAMPQYYFRIRSGRYSGASDHGTELADREAAWNELTNVCGDMIGAIARHLAEDAEWQMELLDESKKPVSRIRLIAESFKPDESQIIEENREVQ